MSDEPFPRDEYYMRLALREAERAAEHGDVPIGAVVVLDGEVIGAAGNERELRKSPLAHAEMIAIEQAAAHMGSWRLLNTVLYVTLEPSRGWSTAPPTTRRAPPARSTTCARTPA
jgi:tRNA(adenine34) deaminase